MSNKVSHSLAKRPDVFFQHNVGFSQRETAERVHVVKNVVYKALSKFNILGSILT